MIRVALAASLQVYDGVEMLGEAEDAETGLTCVERLKPDVVITELVLPRMSGVELTKRLTETFPTIKVIALSASFDERDIDAILAAGARKHLSKNLVSVDELVQTIHEVFRA
jgi:DNA-binding NarL/FixJ family response regulator